MADKDAEATRKKRRRKLREPAHKELLELARRDAELWPRSPAWGALAILKFIRDPLEVRRGRR